MPPQLVKVVVTPEALGEALLNPDGQTFLQAWQEGRVQPVVSRTLLIRYFRLLRRLAIPERLLKWWGYWLASPAKVLILDDPPQPDSLAELCQTLAGTTQAAFIIRGRQAGTATAASSDQVGFPRWVGLRDLANQQLL